MNRYRINGASEEIYAATTAGFSFSIQIQVALDSADKKKNPPTSVEGVSSEVSSGFFPFGQESSSNLRFSSERPSIKKAVTFVTAFFLRSRADSNRCTWFCRPMPKPLGHETILNTKCGRQI